MKPVCLLNIVGLTPRLVGKYTPRLAAVADRYGARPMNGVLPAVTCTAQATMLTGLSPGSHGIVGNGWLYHDTMEVRFWQQSSNLIDGEVLYDAARLRAEVTGNSFTCAKLFWWFNQGADVEWSLTPKPWYGCDGSKVFGILGSPDDFAQKIIREVGEFPFHTFWGPAAGLACTRWIANAAALTLRQQKPTLSLVYLPHLDYDLQRFGVTGADLPRLLAEVDACAGIVIDAAQEIGAEVVVVSEYGIADVSKPLHINRLLRSGGLLEVRDGPFGETIDFYRSRAFAVADHQLAHIYIRDVADREPVEKLLGKEKRNIKLLDESDKQEFGINHPRAGDIVALAAPGCWFTYYYWLDNSKAPDFARTVDIHRKPGYDPCELFVDPSIKWPKALIGVKLLQKKLGFRTRFEVVPLDAGMVRGSHGIPPKNPADGPVFITTAHEPPAHPSMAGVKDYVLDAMELGLDSLALGT